MVQQQGASDSGESQQEQAQPDETMRSVGRIIPPEIKLYPREKPTQDLLDAYRPKVIDE